MTQPPDRCVVFAEIIGGARLYERLDVTEALRALERCQHRLERVAESAEGRILLHDVEQVCACFERCDIAVHAAGEMLERVAALPPTSGVRLSVRIGVHFGPVDESGNQAGEGVSLARMIANHAAPGQALATDPAIRLTTPAMRTLAGVDIAQRVNLRGLEWPLYAVGSRNDTALLPLGETFKGTLEVRYQGQRHVLDDFHPVLLFGRSLGNDVVLDDPHASRQHARIERRDNGFYLIDRSANGTWLVLDSGTEKRLSHESVKLGESGRFGCGHTLDEGEPIYFTLS